MHAGGKRDADEAGNKQPKPGETVIDNTPWMSSLIYHDKGEDKQTLVPLMFLDTTFTTRTTTTTTTELFITLAVQYHDHNHHNHNDDHNYNQDRTAQLQLPIMPLHSTFQVTSARFVCVCVCVGLCACACTAPVRLGPD